MKVQQHVYRPGQALRIPGVSDFRFQDRMHMKVVGLLALSTGRHYPSGIILCIHFCWRLGRPKGNSAAGRIMSMKNSKDIIGNRTHELPAYCAVPQPTAPRRAPGSRFKNVK